MEFLIICWKTFVVQCFIICNVCFFMYRSFVNHQPFPNSQHLIINVLFSHLSVVWQFSNLFSTIFILFVDVNLIEVDAFACLLYFMRTIQICCSGLYVVYISFARFFAHFWSDRYFALPHDSLGLASILTSIGISVLSSLVNGSKCYTGKSVWMERPYPSLKSAWFLLLSSTLPLSSATSTKTESTA